MITLEDVKKNEEVQSLIEGTRKATECSRIYRTWNKAY